MPKRRENLILVSADLSEKRRLFLVGAHEPSRVRRRRRTCMYGGAKKKKKRWEEGEDVEEINGFWTRLANTDHH